MQLGKEEIALTDALHACVSARPEHPTKFFAVAAASRLSNRIGAAAVDPVEASAEVAIGFSGAELGGAGHTVGGTSGAAQPYDNDYLIYVTTEIEALISQALQARGEASPHALALALLTEAGLTPVERTSRNAAVQCQRPWVSHPLVTHDWTMKREAELVFHRADKDGDGFLSIAELETTLRGVRRSSISPEQRLETAMANLDVDKDGRVSLAEWLDAQRTTFERSPQTCKTALKAAAASLDMFEAELAGSAPAQGEQQGVMGALLGFFGQRG